MGSSETTDDPVAALIAQVNRFGPGAGAHQIIPAPLPLATGNLPNSVAVAAALILYRRALDATLRFGDAGSTQLLKAAAAAQAAPLAYVTQNLPAVTAEIRAFGDSVGLPGASSLSTTKILGVPVTTIAIGAAGLVALIYVARSFR